MFLGGMGLGEVFGVPADGNRLGIAILINEHLEMACDIQYFLHSEL